MFNRYAIIAFVVGLVLSPFICHDMQSQGRLISAPPRFVRQKLFDADFVTSILHESGRNSFFYPAHIRDQLDKPDAEERRDFEYTQRMADMHAGFNSDVTIVPTSVVRRSASEGSFWTGQKIKHEFVFSERAVKGENGTSTIFEYTRTWHTSILLSTLHNKNLLPSGFRMESNELLDTKGIDLFRTEVEKAWDARLESGVSSQYVLQ